MDDTLTYIKMCHNAGSKFSKSELTKIATSWKKLASDSASNCSSSFSLARGPSSLTIRVNFCWQVSFGISWKAEISASLSGVRWGVFETGSEVRGGKDNLALSFSRGPAKLTPEFFSLQKADARNANHRCIEHSSRTCVTGGLRSLESCEGGSTLDKSRFIRFIIVAVVLWPLGNAFCGSNSPKATARLRMRKSHDSLCAVSSVDDSGVFKVGFECIFAHGMVAGRGRRLFGCVGDALACVTDKRWTWTANAFCNWHLSLRHDSYTFRDKGSARNHLQIVCFELSKAIMMPSWFRGQRVSLASKTLD